MTKTKFIKPNKMKILRIIITLILFCTASIILHCYPGIAYAGEATPPRFETTVQACDSTEAYAIKKYVKYALIAAGTVTLGTVGFIFAAPIAATIGATGVLGAASTGTAISSLSGVAATNASLAALGGGALGSGALATGMAGGTAVVTGSTAVVGGTTVGVIASKIQQKK